MREPAYALFQSMALYIISLLIVSCADLGVPTPASCNERVAVAIAAVTQVRTTATDLLKARKITPDDAQNVLTQTDSARSGVDIARNFCVQDPATAGNKLTAVSTILQALSSYLATRK